MLESLLTASAEQLIIDNEIIGMAARAVCAIEVDEDRLAFDASREAAPVGTFLAAEHTVNHLRDEFLKPGFPTPDPTGGYKDRGFDETRAMAAQKDRAILSEGPPPATPTAVSKAIDQRVRHPLPHTLLIGFRRNQRSLPLNSATATARKTAV